MPSLAHNSHHLQTCSVWHHIKSKRQNTWLMTGVIINFKCLVVRPARRFWITTETFANKQTIAHRHHRNQFIKNFYLICAKIQITTNTKVPTLVNASLLVGRSITRNWNSSCFTKSLDKCYSTTVQLTNYIQVGPKTDCF